MNDTYNGGLLDAKEGFRFLGLLDVVSMLNTPIFSSERAGMCKRFVNLTRIQPVRSLCQKAASVSKSRLKVELRVN